MPIQWEDKPIQGALIALQAADDPETLWQAFFLSARVIMGKYHDVLLASPLLGTYPVFGRTASGYPRGESYWGRLGEIAGAADVMLAVPDLKVARMSDHFDLSREKDRMMFDEFMVPEGWRYCVNTFFRTPNGMPLGTLAVNRTEAQGDFGDGEMQDLEAFHPHLEAALARICSSQRGHAATLALQNCLYALPLPFLVLDWNFNIIFANLSGREALHLWREGPRKARATNPVLALPEDLIGAATAIRISWEKAVKEDSYEAFGQPRVLDHAVNAGMQASLRPVLPSDGAAFEPGLVIQFVIPDTVHSEAAQAMSAISLLTAMEREVSRLAASGHDNQDIAGSLGISTNTVRAHLRSVFRKLGITNRSRLAPLYSILESK